jgi:hypothetical protein
MSIAFIEYVLPDGKTRQISFDRPAEVENIAHRFIREGGRYEYEILTTGHASITAVKAVGQKDEDDIATRVCQNAPEAVGTAVDYVVRQSEAFIGRAAA